MCESDLQLYVVVDEAAATTATAPTTVVIIIFYLKPPTTSQKKRNWNCQTFHLFDNSILHKWRKYFIYFLLQYLVVNIITLIWDSFLNLSPLLHSISAFTWCKGYIKGVSIYLVNLALRCKSKQIPFSIVAT